MSRSQIVSPPGAAIGCPFPDVDVAGTEAPTLGATERGAAVEAATPPRTPIPPRAPPAAPPAPVPEEREYLGTD